MSAWLDELRRVLDASARPVAFFFRDDDAGWADDELYALLDLFARRALPVDLAAIPCAVTPALAAELRARVAAEPDKVAVHQHGFAHLNHEPAGRKCEFGDARPRELQRRDIELGRRLLVELHGLPVGHVFTPPWNRCTAITGACLRTAGFRVLSRDATAPPLNVAGLAELPVTFDWFARRKGVGLARAERGALLAAAATEATNRQTPVGVMFHHAQMDAAEMACADELLALVAAHANARCRLMCELAEPTCELTEPSARVAAHAAGSVERPAATPHDNRKALMPHDGLKGVNYA
ncbi:MAG TPA: hypothetical protein VF546_02375 [Pyrinomonadaceae bacterium]|jgi:predicted deacetylase